MFKQAVRGLALPFLIFAHIAYADDCKGGGTGCNVADHLAEEPVLHGELEDAVIKILADHPQELLDSLNAYRKREVAKREAARRQAMIDARDQLVNDPMDLVIGNPKGDVTLVEFFDDQCPACKGNEQEIEAVIKADPNVRIVLKEFVLHDPTPGPDGKPNRSAWLGPGSLVAAKLALASKRQGDSLYAALHHELMIDPTPEHHLEMGHIMELAAKVGLNTTKLAQDMAAPEIAAHIEATQDLAQRIGVDSTPGVVVGGEVLRSHDRIAMLAATKVLRSQVTASR